VTVPLSALISEESNENDTLTRKIIDMGSRIIPYEGTEGQDFSKGTGESKNSVRTGYRSARRRYDRYQLRRSYLIKTLKENNLMPSEALIGLSKMQLWEIRAKAATEKITNEELGRVFLWLNQKRGYKSSRSDANLDKKDTQYVADVKSRHQIIKDLDFTIGQYFFDNLKNNEFFRVKENVFPREAYVEEYNTICLTQSKFNPSLNQSLISKIRDEIIYYQRPLKSQKGLVSICEFEGFWAQKDGKKIFAGPKVVHRSNPVFQLSKIWESINNLRIRTKNGDELYLTLDIKNKIFNHLDNNDRLSVKDLCKIIDKKEDEIYVDRKLYKTGIQGNVIKTQIKKCIDNINDFDTLTEFKVKIIEDPKKEAFIFDKKIGNLSMGK
jgi:CRISPR-associated endonuclease Csn1